MNENSSGHENIGVENHRFEHKFDLIPDLTGNRLRHSSGPVRSNHPTVTYIAIIEKGIENYFFQNGQA